MPRKTMLKLSSGLMRSLGPFKGKGHISRQLSKLLSWNTSPMLIERQGVCFAVNGADLIEQQLIFNGIYGKNVHLGLEAFKPTHHDFVFWDIGANIGSVTLPFAKNNPQAIVCSFEPSPPVLTRLSRNIAANPSLHDKIHCFNLALSNQTTLTPFFPSNEHHNSGIGGLYKDHNRENIPVYVQSITAKELVDQGICPRPDIIKVDVEGWELEVLEGFGSILQEKKAPNILFEHSPYRFEARGLSKSVVPDLLQQNGYKLIVIQPDGTQAPFVESMRNTHCDVMATKKS